MPPQMPGLADSRRSGRASPTQARPRALLGTGVLFRARSPALHSRERDIPVGYASAPAAEEEQPSGGGTDLRVILFQSASANA